MRCSVLRTFDIVNQHRPVCCAAHCSVLQCVAVRSSVLQYVAVYCVSDIVNQYWCGGGSVLQCVPECCNVLQSLAVCYVLVIVYQHWLVCCSNW